jgi:GT2 family glycosyltransferase
MSKPINDFNSEDSQKQDDWLIMISYNRSELAVQGLESAKINEPNLKILVVDNGSDFNATSKLNIARERGLIDKLILNNSKDVPQWQKGFAIAQAIKLLALESVKSISIIDDDVIITSDWLKLSENLCASRQDIKIVCLMDDEIQESKHPTESIVKFENEIIKLKNSFNGAFFYMPIETIKTLGFPPYNEGVSEASVEDWYYTRLAAAKSWKIGTIDRCVHLGYADSIRESLKI